MSWETPTFLEINMSAEIGGYQSDFDDREPIHPLPPHCEDAAADQAQP